MIFRISAEGTFEADDIEDAFKKISDYLQQLNNAEEGNEVDHLLESGFIRIEKNSE